MFGKKKTAADSEAALQAESEKNDRRRAEQAKWVTCGAGHIQYAGRGRGCHVPGCRG
ncbi:hypothetical protein [Streptomyces sp. NBC_01237]|uniref:hypothetical protein n=1 Tax=Streptomyces sp. NBC_01237 TaxID=2903790 RepID=UPI002DDBD070|nr:hypothetical protein [Streptomyces sp. NBC_01237]WRZ73903.1 hypothetical protein OG251_20975 [Streptomyces sp. NBC_01237]